MSVIKIQLLVKLCQGHRVAKNDFSQVFFSQNGHGWQELSSAAPVA
jgi:hypothetical protein